jgi:hypothetical protein
MRAAAKRRSQRGWDAVWGRDAKFTERFAGRLTAKRPRLLIRRFEVQKSVVLEIVNWVQRVPRTSRLVGIRRADALIESSIIKGQREDPNDHIWTRFKPWVRVTIICGPHRRGNRANQNRAVWRGISARRATREFRGLRFQARTATRGTDFVSFWCVHPTSLLERLTRDRAVPRSDLKGAGSGNLS